MIWDAGETLRDSCGEVNPFRPDVRPKVMRIVYAIIFALFILAMGVLEIESSRAAARFADYPDVPVSASPAGLAR